MRPPGFSERDSLLRQRQVNRPVSMKKQPVETNVGETLPVSMKKSPVETKVGEAPRFQRKNNPSLQRTGGGAVCETNGQTRPPLNSALGFSNN